MKFHKTIRKIHYISSVFILVFVSFYFISGFFMIRHNLLPAGEPVQKVKEFALDTEFHNDTLAFGRKLREEFDLRGRMDRPITLNDGRLHYFFGRPGETNIAILSLDKDSVEIRETRQMTFQRVVNRLHHIRAFRGGPKYFVWSVMVDMAAFSMVLFALSGIIMWIRVRRKNRYGWLFLGAGAAITIAVALGLYLLP